MSKNSPDAITSKATEKLLQDGGPEKAIIEAEEAKNEQARNALKRQAAEKSGANVDVIVATFTRDSYKHETGAGDPSYEDGQVVEFATYAQYNRWHRRGACETEADAKVRGKTAVAKKVRELNHQKNG
jgi:hypothetical protein